MKPLATTRVDGIVHGKCEHGTYHPFWASAHWMSINSDDPTDDIKHFMTHTCCPQKCCEDIEWQISSLQESCALANQHIIEHKDHIKNLIDSYEDKVSELKEYIMKKLDKPPT